MKHEKIVLMLIILTSMVGAKALAYDACVDGIYYNFSEEEATVTFYSNLSSSNQNAYSGNVTIPKIVTYNGTTYCVTFIGKRAFYGCTGLNSVSIPNSIKIIKEDAFLDCTSLKSVIIPNSVITIERSAFNGCNNLLSVTLPNSVTSVGDYVFNGCSKLTQPIYNSTLFVKMPVSYSGHYTIPEGIKTICGTAFNNCSNLTSINISTSVTSICDEAFYKCGLTSVNIPENVTSIGSLAFNRCSDLETISIPNTITFIGEFAFDNTAWFNKQDDGLVYLGNYVYRYKGTMPESTNIVIEEGTVGIGSGAFKGFSNLTSLSIPNSVISIGQNTFSGCTGLTSIDIPNSVTSIGKWAFKGCSNLSSITIPNSIKSIGGEAFDGTDWYNSQPDGMIYIAKVAYKYKGTMPENTSVTIKDNTTCISDYAFNECSNLVSVIIPHGITYIGQYSFRNCSNLNSVQIEEPTPILIDYSVFLFTNISNSVLYVPIGSKNKYEETSYWNEFKEIVELDVTDISQLDNAIYIEPFSACVGGDVNIEVCLKNAEAATAYVFDLVLPEGVTVAKNDKGKFIDALSNRHDDHTRTFNDKGNNTYSLSTLSGNSEPLTGNDGAIRLLTLHVDNDVAEGVYAIEIRNASYSKPEGTLISLPNTITSVTVEDYVLGDVNGNDGVDIGDAVTIVNYLVGKESSTFVAKAADTNKNGQIDIGDAVTIVNFLVGKTENLSRSAKVLDDKEPQ